MHRVQKICEILLLFVGETFYCGHKARVYLKFAFAEKFFKADTERLAKKGKRFNGRVSLSELNFPQMALGDPREVCQFICSYPSLFAEVY